MTDKFKIHAAIVWLLLDPPSKNERYKIEDCSYDQFTDELKKTNCRWENPPDSYDNDLAAIRQRLNPDWNYSLVYKTRTDNSTPEARDVIDALGCEALRRLEDL